jgi:hypothetical protein
MNMQFLYFVIEYAKSPWAKGIALCIQHSSVKESKKTLGPNRE